MTARSKPQSFSVVEVRTAGAFAVTVTTTHTAAEFTAAAVIVPDLRLVTVRESVSGLRVTLPGR